MDKPTYKEFKAHEKNVNGRLIKTGEGRIYIESTPHRYKYVQAVLFIIFTAAAIIISNIIANDLVIKGDANDYKGFEVSSFYFLLISVVLLSENYLKYISAGFKSVTEDYKIQANIIKKTRPSFIDILTDTIKVETVEQKEVPRNYIFCSDGSIFEEKSYRVPYKAWGIIWYLFWVIPFITIIIVDLFTADIYMVFYMTIGLSLYYLSIFIVFPALRWRLGKFEEVDMSMINPEPKESDD